MRLWTVVHWERQCLLHFEYLSLSAKSPRAPLQPDLPLRLMHDYPVVEADRSVYYAYEDPKGYIDFPTYEQSQTVQG